MRSLWSRLLCHWFGHVAVTLTGQFQSPHDHAETLTVISVVCDRCRERLSDPKQYTGRSPRRRA